jgi:hypothetical protein
MRKGSQSISKVFQPPSQMSWTDEKLAALSKEQLLNLLDNLQTQRESGRVTPEAADEVARLIRARLPASVLKRRQKAAAAQSTDEEEAATGAEPLE